MSNTETIHTCDQDAAIANLPGMNKPLVPAPGSVAIVQLQEMADQMEKCIKTNRHSNGDKISAHTMSEIRGKRDAYNHAISIVRQNHQLSGS